MVTPPFVSMHCCSARPGAAHQDAGMPDGCCPALLFCAARGRASGRGNASHLWLCEAIGILNCVWQSYVLSARPMAAHIGAIGAWKQMEIDTPSPLIFWHKA